MLSALRLPCVFPCRAKCKQINGGGSVVEIRDLKWPLEKGKQEISTDLRQTFCRSGYFTRLFAEVRASFGWIADHTDPHDSKRVICSLKGLSPSIFDSAVIAHKLHICLLPLLLGAVAASS